MNEWEYRTVHMYLEAWQRMNERYEDYVATFADGTRLEGIEMVLRRYLDDGGWTLVTTIPLRFRHDSTGSLLVEALQLIFRRQQVLP